MVAEQVTGHFYGPVAIAGAEVLNGMVRSGQQSSSNTTPGRLITETLIPGQPSLSLLAPAPPWYLPV